MGNESYNHHLHQQNFYTKKPFLPLLCRVSIKDVKLKEYKDRSSASFSADDPSSPKVSCMGHVKKTNRLIGFSTTPYRLTAATSSSCTNTNITTAASASSAMAITSKTNTNSGHFKYTKLKRLFSSKNFTTATTASTSTYSAYGGGSRSCREIIMRRNGSRRSSKINNDDDDAGDHSCHNYSNNHVEVNISELDPPLPVIKKLQQSSEVNLWKRRSGGLALKTLQIEQIHVPKNNYLPATTV
ncbi:hypothetical protein ACH5RR_033897 [Cinchona calisaya]|uniref:Uncharacterized protein n=1 Tax=Cinchona calisaya TaxID=153742 RepID=A0ABD2YBI8_9GENT